MLGVLAAVFATFFSTAKDIVSKGISSATHGNVSACTSFLFALPWYCAVLLVLYLLGYSPFDHTGHFFLFILLRALTDSVAEWSKMHALAYGEISFIANFFSLSIVFLLFLAPLITGDHISNIGLAGVIITVAATLLLLKGPKGTVPWKGVGLALVSAFFFGLNSCFDRLAVQQSNAVFSGFAMTLISGVILLTPMLRVKAWHQQIRGSLAPLVWRGLFEVLFMTFKLFSLQYLEPQYASGIQKLALVFSVIIGGKAFDESDRRKRIVTSLMIVAGSLLIIYSKL